MTTHKFRKAFLSAAILSVVILCMAVSAQAASSPKAPKIKSALQTGDGIITVRWTKRSGVKGYYLEYRTEGTNWVKKRTSKTTLKVKNLETGKTYQFRVRSFKRINKAKIYSKYSAVKTVKVEKSKTPDPKPSEQTTKGYTIKTGNTTTYSDAALKNQSGTILDTDEITIQTVTGTYAYVSYSANGTAKTGYIPVSAILTKTEGTAVTAKAKVETFKRPNGDAYGNVEVNESVQVFGTSDGFTQIKHPVSGGYRYAFIKSTDVNIMTYGSAKVNLSEALYKDSKAAIICGFDGYTDISGRHEGIDIRLKNGSPIYALADGEVIRIENGSDGGSGLSTIAVYNKELNKTVLYLHSNPESMTVGKKITTGDRLGTQGWRGVSSVSNSHTHVEVRNGKEGHAAKSVDNSVLENEDPTPFWNSLGYNVK